MKTLCLAVSAMCLLLASCDFGQSDSKALAIEKEVRKSILDESTSFATLQADYIVTLSMCRPNLIRSDDVFVQKDRASVDYGFQINPDSIRVVKSDAGLVLKVRLKKEPIKRVNREMVERKTTHAGYRPTNKDGTLFNVDGAMNTKLEELSRRYDERNLALAWQNAESFFQIIADRYNLRLDMSEVK